MKEETSDLKEILFSISYFNK